MNDRFNPDRFTFRVWHREDKVMIYDVNSLSLVHGVLLPNEYILMQSTGLYDKNGKLIFEGDFIKYDTTILKVYFDCGMFLTDGDNSDFEDITLFGLNTEEMVEIIGNIFENPELLEHK